MMFASNARELINKFDETKQGTFAMVQDRLFVRTSEGWNEIRTSPVSAAFILLLKDIVHFLNDCSYHPVFSFFCYKSKR